MKRLLAAGTLMLGVGGPLPAQAEEDPFAAMDQLLEQQFNSIDLSLEEQYQRLDQAMENAYQRLGAEVGATWGDDEIKLPSQKTWVDYNDDLSARRVIDFAAGTVTIEQLVDPAADTQLVIQQMTAAAKAAATDSLATLATKDKALQYARADLAAQGINLPLAAEDNTRPVLEDIADNLDVDQLDLVLASALNRDATAGPFKAGTLSADKRHKSDTKQIVSIQIPLKKNHTQTLANKYYVAIAREAARQDLAPSLLLAVMETESAFNPRARSAVPAYGLMQLVPRSGAMDAYQLLYGEKTLLGPEYLYLADNNVELGSAYLSLLHNRYLRFIDDPESREYCVIAGYNTGSGNVAKAFTGDFNVRKAAKIINTMTPLAVYEHLRANLPYEETRHYMFKVTEAQKKYFAFDESPPAGVSL
jgi:membrane-bound lytic murein transglycosylase C